MYGAIVLVRAASSLLAWMLFLQAFFVEGARESSTVFWTLALCALALDVALWPVVRRLRATRQTPWWVRTGVATTEAVVAISFVGPWASAGPAEQLLAQVFVAIALCRGVWLLLRTTSVRVFSGRWLAPQTRALVSLVPMLTGFMSIATSTSMWTSPSFPATLYIVAVLSLVVGVLSWRHQPHAASAAICVAPQSGSTDSPNRADQQGTLSPLLR